MQLFISSVKARPWDHKKGDFSQEDKDRLRVVWRSIKAVSHETRKKVKKCGHVTHREIANAPVALRAQIIGYTEYDEPGFGRLALPVVQASRKAVCNHHTDLAKKKDAKVQGLRPDTKIMTTAEMLELARGPI